RHTRSDRDWSSDVCSSDLLGCSLAPRPPKVRYTYSWLRSLPLSHIRGNICAPILLMSQSSLLCCCANPFRSSSDGLALKSCLREIGRASCRERVWIAVVGG